MPDFNKAPICRERIRRIKPGFGWVDHHLVRDRITQELTPTAMALYLFLICVSDADGVSYWSDTGVAERLRLGRAEVAHARTVLLEQDLLLYEKPLWQLLPLPEGRR